MALQRRAGSHLPPGGDGLAPDEGWDGAILMVLANSRPQDLGRKLHVLRSRRRDGDDGDPHFQCLASHGALTHNVDRGGCVAGA